jgi:hypothetical protein
MPFTTLSFNNDDKQKTTATTKTYLAPGLPRGDKAPLAMTATATTTATTKDKMENDNGII